MTDVQRNRAPVDVLLVDDNPGDIRLTREALKQGGVPVTLNVAIDGEEAVEFLFRRGKYAHAPRPHLILLDLNLPRKSGREVLLEIKSDPDLKDIPVLIMSSSSAPQDIEGAYNLNANCYVSKPLELDQFMDMIQSIEDFWLTKATLPERADAGTPLHAQ